ncbi:Pol [Symbiodinium natans]|uniref:Pol protein n=1 Tax=Symbiodinium natans TaxID=878477 RepID=A0A812S1G6_9DINO|nr:Pol [Symbiodinium natans]
MNVTASALEASWHRVQLHLIPKVQLVKEPKNLRPIALLHPANKLLATMIADKVQDKVLAYLTHVPQWAYLQGRSTSDALTAVCAHMHQVRELLASQTRSLPQRFQGCERHQVIGGVSISLDVKKAFDSLSHAFLAEAMRDAEFEHTEIDLILHLHSQACLCVGSHRDSAQIFLGTGVRQGCSLSPLLWSLATGRFYRLYLTALKNQGLSEGLTNMFADDVFGSWVFKSPEAFKKAIRAIGVLVHTLQQVGLQLSMEKTVVLLAIAGTSSPSLLSKYKAQIDNVPHLQIPVGRDKLAFKIVSSHKYLGAKVSYSLHSVGLPAQGPSMIRHAVHRQLYAVDTLTPSELSDFMLLMRTNGRLCQMDLEGVSRDDLLEAAAELQHLQTMALQGANFGAFQPTRSTSSGLPAAPPTPEVSLTALPSTAPTTAREHGQPSKYTRPNGKGPDRGKGPSARPAKLQPFPAGTSGSQPSSKPASAALVGKVVQLVLRHEDFLTGLAQSTSWVMFEGTAPPLSTIAAQAKVAEQWHNMKEESPESIKLPLRTILFQTWASELKTRLEALITDPASRQEAVRLQALTEPDILKYKRLRALEDVDTKAPLSLREVIGLLEEAIVLSTVDGVLVNYHSTRKLLPEMSGPTVTFALVLGLREPKSFRMWSIIDTLSGNAALMLVATTLRKERRSRSQLAQSVTQDLRQLSLVSSSDV